MIIAGRTETSDILSRPVNKAINKEKITDLISELKRSPAGLSEQIRLCISYATAYHHAGTRVNFAYYHIISGFSVSLHNYLAHTRIQK